MKSLLFFVNERARSGGAVPVLLRSLAAPLLQSVPTSVVRFVDDDGIRKGLETLKRGMTPVAVGGDGTLVSVVRILREAGRAEEPIGVLPLGTGNGVAHSLGIGDLSQATEALVTGAPRSLDVMTTTHPDAPLSLLSISVGVESLAMQDFAKWRRTSRWVGALAGGLRRGTRRVSGITVEADGQRHVSPRDQFCNVGLYNVPCYGFGVTPHPRADAEDGLADLRIHRGRVGYWAYMAAALLNRASPLNRRPDWLRIQHATISSPLPVQIDGETLPAAQFDVNVLRGAVRILATVTETS
ncbi:MAG: hypothetical protein HN712_03325 [Gemmatimonadetes bacterium]|nr:hypothetical protein [Gemmatimonadota bacterium]MBT6145759.1 hypothetical protein [Gemmatimonadota bacterium]MBT7859310.1 hypothetical protein [Gemmatimonadota bacterium]